MTLAEVGLFAEGGLVGFKVFRLSPTFRGFHRLGNHHPFQVRGNFAKFAL